MTRPGAELKVPAWVRRLPSLLEEVTGDALAESRDFLRDEARRNASKGGPTGLRVRTGTLLRSIRTYLKAKPSGGGEVSLGMRFYGWVHDRGKVIVPKTAPYLRFRLPNGRWVSSKRVVLPERRFARDALDATRKKYPAFLRQALRRATR